MEAIVRILGSTIIWILLWILGQGFSSEGIHVTASLLDIYYIPVMGLAISVISTLYPAIADMGVAKYKKANLYERLFPLGVVGLLLYISTWFTPTIVVAAVNSYYMGVASSYVFKVLAGQMGWDRE